MTLASEGCAVPHRGGTVELRQYCEGKVTRAGRGQEAVQDADGAIRIGVRSFGSLLRQDHQHPELLQSQHESFLTGRSICARTIRGTLPEGDTAALRALPGVLAADRHGDAVILSCSDADTALRALLAAFPAIRDVEVRGGSLEEAFMELTADQSDTATDVMEAAR